jgi:hypothetical protein
MSEANFFCKTVRSRGVESTASVGSPRAKKGHDYLNLTTADFSRACLWTFKPLLMRDAGHKNDSDIRLPFASVRPDRTALDLLPNVQDEPRPWLARLVLLGARGVTAMVVGSGVLLGFFTFADACAPECSRV